MSGAEEAGGGGPASGSAGAGPVGVGPGAAAGPAAAAALGEAAGPGLPEEAGLAGARQLQEAAGDPDAPPKKRLRAAEAAEAAAGSGKLEERLYSVLCCTVCLDLPKASVYQVGPPARPRPGPARPAPGHHVSSEARPGGRDSGARLEAPPLLLSGPYFLLEPPSFLLRLPCLRPGPWPPRCVFAAAPRAELSPEKAGGGAHPTPPELAPRLAEPLDRELLSFQQPPPQTRPQAPPAPLLLRGWENPRPPFFWKNTEKRGDASPIPSRIRV